MLQICFLCINLVFKNIRSILMAEGTVKFFNESKGFGFIQPSTGEKDIFVHVSGLQDDIRENDKVSYEVENGRKGLNAVNVRVI
jgi:CspA family cold shock protein